MVIGRDGANIVFGDTSNSTPIDADDAGNVVPYIESVGYRGMMQEMLGIVAPVALIWTLSSGAVGLVKHTRTRGSLTLENGARNARNGTERATHLLIDAGGSAG